MMMMHLGSIDPGEVSFLVTVIINYSMLNMYM